MTDSDAAAPSSKRLVVRAFGAGAVLFACCIFVPVLLGAGFALTVVPLVEAVVLVLVILVGGLVLRHRRAGRCRC